MSTKRLKFSAAEKFRVALEAIKGEKTIAEISAHYSVHATQISSWKKQALEYLATSFTDKHKPKENYRVNVVDILPNYMRKLY